MEEFEVWKGKLQHQYLATGQQGYANAAPVVYPEGIEVIDCALGTNPLGTPPAVRRFLEGLQDVPVCGYPQPEPEDLKKAIASKYASWCILPEHVLVSGGSMGVLITLARLMLSPGTSFAGISPQFTDAVLQMLYTGASYQPLRSKGPRFPIEPDLLHQLTKDGSSVIYIDRPNNPTGQVIPLDITEQVARNAMEKKIWVIIDEAYGDFLPDEESAASIDLPNIVTCRSFSKGLGGAGLRVGFAVSRSPELSKAFRTLQPPFAVGILDSLLAEAILGDESYLDETRRYVRAAKEKMIDALNEKKGLTVAETDLRVPIALLTREEGDLAAGLAAAGISCEPGLGFFDLDARSVRLRVPSPAQLDEFLRRIGSMQ